QIDTPTQNLENYFLSVVQNARRAAAETSGATSGARVAEYLRAGGVPEAAGEKLLERLSAPQAAAPVPAAAAPAEKRVNEQKRAARAKPPEAAPAPAPADSPNPADLQKANEKLSSLLGPGQS